MSPPYTHVNLQYIHTYKKEGNFVLRIQRCWPIIFKIWISKIKIDEWGKELTATEKDNTIFKSYRMSRLRRRWTEIKQWPKYKIGKHNEIDRIMLFYSFKKKKKSTLTLTWLQWEKFCQSVDNCKQVQPWVQEILSTVGWKSIMMLHNHR